MSAYTLQFLGAAGSVTGSKHLLTTPQGAYLIDCGMFQGERQLRERNWQPPPLDVKTLQAVVLTHAHLDHSGYLPRLEHEGYQGPIYASQGTAELLGVLLPDAGRLQEEEAHYRNRKQLTRHQPALPLYTEAEARAVLQQVRPLAMETPFALGPGAELRLRRAAHILGSCFADFKLTPPDGGAGPRILFTGDLGRIRQSSAQTMAAGPETVSEAVDYLVLESTYGDRQHPDVDIGPDLARTLAPVLGAGGVVVIPAFAIERTQKLLFLLKHLMETGAMPRVPMHVDSPMAIEAIEIFLRHGDEFNEETRELIGRYGPPQSWDHVFFDKTAAQSQAVNGQAGPLIIISSSGMAAGGRVMHHLALRLPDPKNLVVFVGYQAPGTLGNLIKSGHNPVTIFKQSVPVRAKIAAFEQFSDHADAGEIIAWLRGFPRPPRRIFLVHGEPESAAALAHRIEAELHWPTQVAKWLEEVTLG